MPARQRTSALLPAALLRGFSGIGRTGGIGGLGGAGALGSLGSLGLLGRLGRMGPFGRLGRLGILGVLGVWACLLTLSGCQPFRPAPTLEYLCPHQLRFTARLYQDMAQLDGMRGFTVLERVADEGSGESADARPPSPSSPSSPDKAKRASGAPPANRTNRTLTYAEPTVRAVFGLGIEGQLVRLDYTNIPEPIYCRQQLRAGERARPPRAAPRNGPRPPPPPPDPNAPVKTNIRTTDEPIPAG